MKSLTKVLFALLATLSLAFTVAACSPQTNAPAEPIVDANTVIIDVRTPEEFAAGHLENATLIDLNSGQFHAAVPQLDPDASYVVYCRSGNRSSQAVALMKEAGIAKVTDLGSLENASKATGIDVVR